MCTDKNRKRQANLVRTLQVADAIANALAMAFPSAVVVCNLTGNIVCSYAASRHGRIQTKQYYASLTFPSHWTFAKALAMAFATAAASCEKQCKIFKLCADQSGERSRNCLQPDSAATLKT
jgi:hypothetical protein